MVLFRPPKVKRLRGKLLARGRVERKERKVSNPF
jgi:hypothetical protein